MVWKRGLSMDDLICDTCDLPSLIDGVCSNDICESK